ncbi:MAG: epimerase [Crocinitomicaceae bacterium]|nr:epimerase [Crocinitomicaceae bacterium]|tara:strand:- start:14005 stop:14958 length:954 start_codon:yes stop_codon:yes gene_type:complete
MRILLTGAAGFIGSHLSERLLRLGHEVIGIDNFDPFYDRSIKEENLSISKKSNSFRFFELDFATDVLELTNLPEFDILIHLGAKAGVRPSIADPKAYIEANYTGTLNLLELLKTRGIKKMVFASSSSVYGNCLNIPFTETEALDQPISPYAFTKRGCEMMNYTYHHLENIDIVNLRFFTVYGPRQRPDLAIHKFIKKILNDEPIQMFGDGSTARDYTFIQDIVSGIVSSMDYILENDNCFEIVNIGNNQPVKLKDLIVAIENTLGKQAVIEQQPMQPGDVDITFANIAKAQKLLNYQPTTSIEEGLKEFVSWIKVSA